ncbi:hypothetical protein [Psychrobacter alimentarius]|nr:hypothetical protein [Psychrobacter alimentarius]
MMPALNQVLADNRPKDMIAPVGLTIDSYDNAWDKTINAPYMSEVSE